MVSVISISEYPVNVEMLIHAMLKISWAQTLQNDMPYDKGLSLGTH